MPKAISEKKAARRRVNFSLEAPEAKEVMLMGDFNTWNEKKHPMKKDQIGVWRKTVVLVPGRYEYRFLVDGQWWNDPQNNETCFNRFGTQNNVFTVV